jgi:heme/copper-type cytochrome/quinol oxidase subunit 4
MPELELELFVGLFGTLIALIRNGACNVRTLAPGVLAGQSGIRGVSVIGAIIGITQGIASLLGTFKGVKLVMAGYSSRRRVAKWIAGVMEMTDGPEKEIMTDGLKAEMGKSVNDIIVGFLEYITGLCFFVLASSTLGYLDNVDMVIFALLLMNVALVYFLYLMWKSYSDANLNAKLTEELAAKLDGANFSDEKKAVRTLMKCAAEAGFAGKLHEAISRMDAQYKAIYANPKANSSMIEAESDVLETLLSDLCLQNDDTGSMFVDVHTPPKARGRSKSPARGRSKSPMVEKTPRKRGNSKGKAVNGGKSPTTSAGKAKVARSVAAYGLRQQSRELSVGAGLELTYFILNFIAFYGYSLCILAYYFANSNDTWHHMLKFGMTHTDSDWWGNLAGDLAWTIEPAIILYQSLGKVTKPVMKEKQD